MELCSIYRHLEDILIMGAVMPLIICLWLGLVVLVREVYKEW